MSDLREFQKARCFYCKSVPTWLVSESDDPEADFMLACDIHKYTCFS